MGGLPHDFILVALSIDEVVDADYKKPSLFAWFFICRWQSLILRWLTLDNIHSESTTGSFFVFCFHIIAGI